MPIHYHGNGNCCNGRNGIVAVRERAFGFERHALIHHHLRGLAGPLPTSTGQRLLGIAQPGRVMLHRPTLRVVRPDRSGRALTVAFNRVMDTALAADQIEVITADGRPIDGRGTLDASGTTWRFVPRAAWARRLPHRVWCAVGGRATGWPRRWITRSARNTRPPQMPPLISRSISMRRHRDVLA